MGCSLQTDMVKHFHIFISVRHHQRWYQPIHLQSARLQQPCKTTILLGTQLSQTWYKVSAASKSASASMKLIQSCAGLLSMWCWYSPICYLGETITACVLMTLSLQGVVKPCAVTNKKEYHFSTISLYKSSSPPVPTYKHFHQRFLLLVATGQ